MSPQRSYLHNDVVLKHPHLSVFGAESADGLEKSTMTETPTRIRLGGAWERTTTKGRVINIPFEGLEITLWENDQKRHDRSPDWNVTIAERAKREER